MIKKSPAADHPHIGLAVFATGVMALGLAAGLKLLKVVDRLDEVLVRLFSPAGLGAAAQEMDAWVLWAGTGIMAFFLPAVILNIPGNWRRLMLWGITLVLTSAWGPVLVLCALKPNIGVALVAVLWSGFCAMFYTTNHVLPVDKPPLTPDQMNNGPR
ncbi:MAG: hypothetical protein H7Y36_06585 [Armatimonadetes bacterium]|nr:hypothetical protein [Akkermansiaceae bacterium]